MNGCLFLLPIACHYKKEWGKPFLQANEVTKGSSSNNGCI
ncbi:hypothetical protein FLA_5637 [Filimonas lacunae]|nr:hypothetical protein FLA_5637 [Filimonas lacunae]